jgi:hypothetical protein
MEVVHRELLGDGTSSSAIGSGYARRADGWLINGTPVDPLATKGFHRFRGREALANPQRQATGVGALTAGGAPGGRTKVA